VEGDFGIVETGSIQTNFGPAGAAAEEIDGTAGANGLDGHLPCGGRADGFDDGIGAEAARRELADGADRVGFIEYVESGSGAEALCGIELRLALAEGYDSNATAGEDMDELEADGAAADNDGSIAGRDVDFVDAAEDTGERLNHCGFFEANMLGNFEQVLANDAVGDTNKFGVGAVIEQQILAETGLGFAAEEADAAGGGIGGNYAHAGTKDWRNCRADSFDDSGKLVAEEGGRLNHAGVIAAAPDFEVSATGESDFHADEDFVDGDGGDGDTLDAKIFTAM